MAASFTDNVRDGDYLLNAPVVTAAITSIATLLGLLVVSVSLHALEAHEQARANVLVVGVGVAAACNFLHGVLVHSGPVHMPVGTAHISMWLSSWARLAEVVTLVSEAEWRFPDRPTVQMVLPYCFIADELVYLSQIGTFAHYRRDPLPGTIFGGRFPLSLWPRPLMWAFEWHEPEKDLILRRGEPLFYCQFEGEGPDRPVQVVEAERTPELQTYLEQIGGVVNYVNQTFGLFKAAEAIRPKKLLTPKARE